MARRVYTRDIRPVSLVAGDRVFVDSSPLACLSLAFLLFKLRVALCVESKFAEVVRRNGSVYIRALPEELKSQRPRIGARVSDEQKLSVALETSISREPSAYRWNHRVLEVSNLVIIEQTRGREIIAQMNSAGRQLA